MNNKEKVVDNELLSGNRLHVQPRRKFKRDSRKDYTLISNLKVSSLKKKLGFGPTTEQREKYNSNVEKLLNKEMFIELGMQTGTL